MEKIIIDNKYKNEKLTINNDSHIKIELDSIDKKLKIVIGDNINVKIFCKSKNTKNEIEYIIGENSTAIVDNFLINTNDSIIVNLNKENAKITYNTGIINNLDSSYHQIINHNESQTESKIINHVLTLTDHNFNLIIDGVIKKNSNDSNLIQDNKIVNLKNGKSFIKPNLIIDNNEVSANHSAYIGGFDENIKFYMMSRGIKEKETYQLLIRSFLLSSMSLYKLDREELISIIEKEMEAYIE